MKANYALYPGLIFEFESNKLQDIIQEITALENAVGYEQCGKCKKDTNVFPVHRKTGDNDFYELKCFECGAVLQLGTHKKGQTLYKKKMKTDDDGKAVKSADDKAVYLKDGGWLKWNKTTQQME